MATSWGKGDRVALKEGVPSELVPKCAEGVLVKQITDQRWTVKFDAGPVLAFLVRSLSLKSSVSSGSTSPSAGHSELSGVTVNHCGLPAVNGRFEGRLPTDGKPNWCHEYQHVWEASCQGRSWYQSPDGNFTVYPGLTMWCISDVKGQVLYTCRFQDDGSKAVPNTGWETVQGSGKPPAPNVELENPSQTSVAAKRIPSEKGSDEFRMATNTDPALARPRSMEGWMEKQGNWRKNWKRRYFILDPRSNSLIYKESPESSEIKGSVDVSNVKSLTPHDMKPYSIALGTENRTWYFACQDEEERKNWLYAIMAVINEGG